MEAAASRSASTSSAASSVDGRGSGSTGDYLNLGMFGGQQSGVGDLLLGAGGFGGSLGNGFGNDANAANSSNAGASSTGAGSAFDLSDFPSLGGNTNGGVQPSATGGSGNGLAAALRQQQQLMQHQQMLQGNNAKSTNLYRLATAQGANGGANFKMATEDFPALPGAPPVGSSVNSSSAPNSSSLLLGGSNNSGSASVGGGPFGTGQPNSVSRVSSSGSVGGLYGGELESGGGSQLDGGGLLGGAGIGGLGVLGGLQQSSNPASSLSVQSRASNSAPGTVGSSSNSAVGSGSAAGTALSGDYGLLGLLGVIRMTDADRNSLALGSDLTLLGLSLGSSDQIYQTFSSPWTETVSSKEPHYQVRTCL